MTTSTFVKFFPLLAAIALFSEPAPAEDKPAAGSCRYVPVAKVPFEYTDASRHLSIEGGINGTRVRMLLDTGASETHLLRGPAEQLGIPLAMTNAYVSGIGGNSLLYAARLKDFAIGEKQFGKTTIHVIRDSAVEPGIAALVGDDFLLQMDLELSMAGRYIQFLKPTNCGDTFLAYWDKDAMEVPFSAIEEVTRKPYIPVQLNGVWLQAILDTGATHSGVTRKAAARAGLTPDSPGVSRSGSSSGIGTAIIPTWIGTFNSFTIGNETIRNAELTILDDAPHGSDGVDMILGVDYLRAHRVLFAISQRRLYLSYIGGEVFGGR
jgi:predicted aspartyl protease